MRVPTNLLRETLTIEDFLGNGARGTLHGAARTTRSSVQPTSKLVTDSRGQQVVVEILAIIRPEAGPVLAESIITWAGTRYRVVSAYAMPDTRRPSHWELALARYAG